MNYQNDLNDSQLEAVTTSFQRVRIVAGAGSGKTRVLTYRISYLIEELHVAPWKILAITFTNKVANEMRNRVIKLAPSSEKDLTIKTFHSFAAMFLRREINVINFPISFTILDEEDQTKMLKDIGASLGYKRTDPLIKKAMEYISRNKLQEHYPDDIKIDHEKFEGEKECLEIYTLYEENKDRMYCLDFDDLLLKTNQILTNFPDIREKWQRKIDHILVDEFQDTNNVEYRLIKLLSKPSTCLYVVGDPDQTIYTWRGANQDIILNLEKDYPGIDTVVLDRNYRSTQSILDSANKLINYNKFRIKKNLYTENNLGKPVTAKRFPSVTSEANFLAKEVRRLHDVEHYLYKDIVVLYRSSYVTFDFEAALTAHQIPYSVYGGLKFWARREIKDVLAFFKLLVNDKDDISFERIINVPRRGIGESSINTFKLEAKEMNMSLMEYARKVDGNNTALQSRVVNALKRLIVLLDHTKDELNKDEEVFSKVLEDMLQSVGYYDELIKEEDGEERLENVKQLFADFRHFLKTYPDCSLDEYLQNVTLISAQDEVTEGDNITLMTVHTAKGLEYPVVFVVRFNDTVFPHARSVAEGYKALEEERRLAYVAMTRAKEMLYLTCADGFSYVAGGNLTPSQFFAESGNAIKDEHFEYTPFRSNKRPSSFHFGDGEPMDFTKDEPSRQDFSQVTNDVISWAVGDVVIHKTLGRGVVIALEGDDIIQVKFDEHGIKSLLGSHKALSKGGHES